jgi:hypothetical protein
MKVPQNLEIDWGKTYLDYMKQAAFLELGNTDAHLKPLAELCYKHLRMLINNYRMDNQRILPGSRQY